MKKKFLSRNVHKPKSTFNPCNEDAANELYLSSLEERVMQMEVPRNKFNNLTRREHRAFYVIKIDKNTGIKGADKV